MTEQATQQATQEAETPILILMLTSGQEIMADVVMDEMSFYLKKPVSIIHVPNEESQKMGLAFVPFMPYADQDGGIVLSRIGTHMAIPSDAMVRSYTEFTTGIALPDNRIQLA